MASDMKVSLLFQVLDRATAPIRRLNESFNHFKKNADTADKYFQRAANMRQAAEGVKAFSDRLRGALAAPTEKFEDFQATMSKVKALTKDLTENEFVQLTAKAKDLGATTRYTATQSAEAMSYFAIAGYNANEQLAVVPQTLSLATAAGMDLGRTADILSDTLGAFQFGKSATEAARVSNVLARTFTGANVTLETLFESMKVTAPVAKQFGVEIEDVSAMIGLLGGVGIKGSAAGTAMRTMFAKLASPRKFGRDVLEYLKVDVIDKKTKALRPLPEVLAEIIAATNKMGSAKQGAALARVFGLEAFTAAGALSQMGKEQIYGFINDIKTSTKTVDDIARVMDDNARGATIRLQSATEGLQLTLGEALEPSLTAAKTRLISLVSSMTEFTTKHPTMAKAIMISVAAVAALTSGLAALMFTLASLTTALGIFSLAMGSTKTGPQVLALGLKKLLPLLRLTGAAVSGTTAKIAAMNVAGGVTVGMLGAIAAAVGAVGLAVYELKKHWKDLNFLEGMKGMWESMKDVGITGTILRTLDPRALLKDLGIMGKTQAPTVKAPTAAPSSVVSGEIGVKVESDLPSRVTKLKSGGPLNITADTGFMMGAQ